MRELKSASLDIEGYQLIEEIGRGGVGVVYSALDLTDETLVAIKVLKLPSTKGTPSTSSISGSSSTSINAQRLFQELVTATRIRHPNVVKIIDFGVADTQELYVVMDLLVGADMSRLKKRRAPLPFLLIIKLFKEVLSAISQAHQQQIVHQDIKPSNLFLSTPPQLDLNTATDEELMQVSVELRLVVMDFGIARRIRDEDPKRELVGSLPYMAPEYLQKHQVNATGDVYQLGLTLIEMITGERAAQGKGGMQLMYQHVTGELTVPDSLRKGAFGATLAKSIALNPEERYPDAASMLDALSALSQADLRETDRLMRGEVDPTLHSAETQVAPPPAPTPPLSPSPLELHVAPDLEPQPAQSHSALSFTQEPLVAPSDAQILASEPTLPSAPKSSDSLTDERGEYETHIDASMLMRSEVQRLSEALQARERAMRVYQALCVALALVILYLLH